MNSIRYIHIKHHKATMIRQYTPPLTIQLWIFQRCTVRRLDHANFGIGDDTIEPTGFWVGGATPETVVSEDGGAAVGFGAGGELREGDFVFLEAEYVDVAV